MDPNTQRLFEAAAGGAGGGAGAYIEDVFSTWLYTGTGSTQTITNGIDLAGEGGLTWIKQRNGAANHYLFDTVRGASHPLFSDTTAAQGTNANLLPSFNSDGFTVGTGGTNSNTATYASWTFRKAEKFFDVVTWSGNSSVRNISHNLGSTPGMIIVKSTSSDSIWTIWHRSANLSYQQRLRLDTLGIQSGEAFWGDSSTPPDMNSSTFSVGTSDQVNSTGRTYVAYLFAHDAGGFGDNGTESVIKCGSYTGTGSAGDLVTDLGWEPQWILVKNTTNTGDWLVFDVMRGMSLAERVQIYPNTSDSEFISTAQAGIYPTPTGFGAGSSNSYYNQSGSTHIYIAIRRGPMKTPEDATEVFSMAYGSSPSPAFKSNGHIVDFGLFKLPDSVENWRAASRLTGLQYMYTDSTSAEVTSAGIYWDYMSGFLNSANSSYLSWMFRRAPGFFDVVAYTGTGVARTVNHNLGVAPGLMIVKCRSNAVRWIVYSADLGGTKYLLLDGNEAEATFSAAWNDTDPTDTVFTVGTTGNVNTSGRTYIAYLFATRPGVSKVGSYTGTAGTQQIDCGFTAGARFVLIKRTDSTGDWYVWDSARGITAGNDPYLLLNSTAAEVTDTDYIDTLSTGFEITSTAPAAINASGGSFVFLAVA